MKYEASADDFLRRHGMHPDLIDFDGVKLAFAAEMHAGLEGKASSLQMIPTYLSTEGRPKEGQTALAVDIGGTNLRLALTRVQNGTIEIADTAVFPVPGAREELTKEEFLRQVAGRMLPFMGTSDTVGICFSHPAEILPNRDGRLVAFSKEIRVTGAAGMEICRELSDTLAGMGIHTFKKYVLLNDTAAVLLGGTSRTGAACGGDAGLVIGTGLNISYVERTDRIIRASGQFGGAAMVVNTEAGGFDKIPFGALATAFFETTDEPAEHRLEKITAGRYLGQLILFALKRAAAEGLLSEGAAEALLGLASLPTPETSLFLSNTTGGGLLSGFCRAEQDRAVFSTVIDRVYERAAKLTAAAIAAVLHKTDAGTSVARPACVTAEGSTFYKLHTFRDRFGRYVREQIERKDGRHMRLVSVESATIVGTALAAMIQDSSVQQRHNNTAGG